MAIMYLLGAIAAIYGLHRLALNLEDKGHLYYLRRKPSGGAAGSFVAMHRLFEPQYQHVEHVSREFQRVEEDEAGGRGDGGTPTDPAAAAS